MAPWVWGCPCYGSIGTALVVALLGLVPKVLGGPILHIRGEAP